MIHLHNNSIKLAILESIVCVAQSSPVFSLEQASSQRYSTQSTTSTNTSKHPKLKRIGKAAAIGVLTGGLSGIVLGGSILAHAVVGAGARAGIASVKEYKAEKKKHHHQHDAQTAHTVPGKKQENSSEKKL